ncbi:MAG TPA: capsule assembly Wzi family protein [Bacteroidota bacterium]|nr:capsule assembly Wzi family protein [Bacteroidota bacterium]
MKKSILTLAIMLAMSHSLYAQTVYLPATHEVYKFLDEMAAKQIIGDYRDAVKPLSRHAIAKFLIRVDSLASQLTAVEQGRLKLYKEEFYQELKSLNSTNLPDERWHLYGYQSDPTQVVVDVIGSASENRMADGKKLSETTNGIFGYGYVGSNVGAYFYYHDSHDGGSYVNSAGTYTGSAASFRPLTPLPAAVITNPGASVSSFDYDVFNAQVNFDLGFVTLTAEQMQNVWGSGENSNIIQSTKAPAFPQLKLRARLSKDIDFTYIHGWLFSGVIDSSQTYNTQYWGIRPVYMNKYIAANMLEVTPWNGVNIAVGESEIYGGPGRSPELFYLIPIMFFKAAEHYLDNQDNSQVYFNLKCDVIKNFDFYFPIFFDEFSTTTFLSPSKNHNQVAFTAGGNAYDLFYHDTRINVEYTRVNPWVYNHQYVEDSYQNHGANLGDWIGQNADLFTVSAYHRPLYNLEVGLTFQSLRKGGKENTYYQYNEVGEPPLLYGPLTKQQSFGIVATYQPLRDLFIDFHALRTRFTTQMTPTYTDNTGYNEYTNNVFDYVIDPSYAGKYDVLLGIRYNVY